MILLLRAATRLATFVLLAALAACGAAIAVFSIGSGAGDFSLPGLARLMHLGRLRDHVGELLSDLAGRGPVAAVAVLSGLGALVLAVLLLAGVLWPRRERLVILERGEQGTLAARRRALARAGGALVEQVREVAAARVRVRPGRRGGGRLTVRITQSRSPEADDVRGRTQLALAPLTEAFGLRAGVKAGVKAGPGRHRGRVE